MHIAIDAKLFRKLNHENIPLNQIEFAKAEIEQKESTIPRFFTFQYAKLRKSELYYNFFNKRCDANMLKELEMDTDSLYLALAEKEQEDCIRLQKKAECEHMRPTDSTDVFVLTLYQVFPPKVPWKAEKA